MRSQANRANNRQSPKASAHSSSKRGAPRKRTAGGGRAPERGSKRRVPARAVRGGSAPRRFDPNSQERIRIVKYLAACGVTSRRKAADFVSGKRVTVNGEIVTDLSYGVDPVRDRVTVDGKTIRAAEQGLVVFYKPKFVLSTLSDPHGRKCVSDYLTKHFSSYVPVGRLDYESEGLMILTNDGDLANVLLHPKFELDRTYEVHSPGFVGDSQLKKLETGVDLEDGPAKAQIHLMHRTSEHSTIEVTIQEGRNRQVRRMFEVVGAEITMLKRIQHGPFVIAGLRPGEMKKLSEREFYRLRDKIMSEAEARPEQPSRK